MQAFFEAWESVHQNPKLKGKLSVLKIDLTQTKLKSVDVEPILDSGIICEEIEISLSEALSVEFFLKIV